MHLPGIYEELAALRCAERQQQSLHNLSIGQALAGAPHPARRMRRPIPFLRRIALRAAWRLTRLADAESGPYTVREQAILMDARGRIRTVCPGEIALILLPRADRDAA